MKKNFIIFEALVDEAIYGDVMLSDISSLVKKLKKEKANIIKAISALEGVSERRAAYKQLNRLMYQLYGARCCVKPETKDDKGKVIPAVYSIIFIEENIDKVCNLNLRRKVEELRREFYINCCVVLDKSHPKNKKKICEDKLIEAIYYERDKNCAHRDDDYKSPEFNQLSDMIETMKHQIQKVLVVCKDSLPNNITLDFVSHDKELFRLIYGITAEREEEIKHRKYPEYGKTPRSGDFITKKIFQEAEDIRTIKNKNEYAVIIENGINFYEALQNRQDACIKINVLYNLETWCSFNQEFFSKIQKLKKVGGLNEFDMPVMPKDNAQLEEFMSLLLE